MKKRYDPYKIVNAVLIIATLFGVHLLSANGVKKVVFRDKTARPGLTMAIVPDSTGILYVDSAAVPGGGGDSWGNALAKLSDALQEANSNDAVKEIRVARGTYYPTGIQTGTERDSAFAVLRGGLKLLGGYDATSGSRNAENNMTVLSGNIGASNDSLDNSYHLIVMAGIGSSEDSVLVDGFTIRDGNADGSGERVYNGLAINQKDGGGILLNAVRNETVISHCLIENNTSSEWGGGTYYTSNSSPGMKNCRIVNNRSGVGGGMLNDQSSSPELLDCMISNNEVWQNSGGGIFNNHSSPVFINCIISGNISTGSNGGGGMRNFVSSPTLINSVVVNNMSLYNGAGMRNNSASSPRIYNSIIWDNKRNGSLDNIYNDATDKDKPFFNYTYLQATGTTWTWGSHSTGVNGGGNSVRSESPFADAENGDYHLRPGSLAINTGNNDSIPAGITADIAGDPRIVDVTVDMGAYEYQEISLVPDAQGILYVNNAAVAGGNGNSWTNALATLSDAVLAANSNTAIREIHVAGGTYYPTGEQTGTARDASFAVLRGGIKILGGYDAATGDRNAASNLTTLSGDIGTLNDSLDNSYHVLVMAGIGSGEDSIVVDGFTIKGGNAMGTKTEATTYNGLTVARAHGGGLYLNKVLNNVAIRYCNISGNVARNWGGGMYNSDGSAPYLLHCNMYGNKALEAGGGVLNDKKSAPRFIDCMISGNTAVSNSGGAMFNNDSDPFFVNCIISGNTSAGSNGAGGFRNFQSAPAFINCVIANNNAVNNYGGGMRNNGTSTPHIYNSIFWNNKGHGVIDNIRNDAGGDKPKLAYTYLQGDSSSWAWDAGYSGADEGGNIISETSPFLDADNGDVHLSAGSLAINAGNNDSVPAGITTDIEGDPRFVDGSVDMGAYEDQHGPVTIIIRPDASGIVYVNDDAAAGGNGSSWSKALTKLSDALNAANHNMSIKEIRIARGTYYPTGVQDDTARDSSFAIFRGGLKLAGGYDAENGNRNVEDNPTMLSGDIGILHDSLDNSFHVMVLSVNDTAENSIVIDGLTIEDAHANGSGDKSYRGKWIPRNKGAGIYMDSILNNLIIVDCAFQKNTADSGGGMYCDNGSSPWLFNCIFSANNADHKGGGIYITHESSPWLINTAFYGNMAGNKGGGMYNDDNSSPSITNCNFYGNTAHDKGGGIYNNHGSNPVISNTILYGNNVAGIYNHESSPVISYSIVQGTPEDTLLHIYNGDPNFANPAVADFHLQPGSPAIDAGSNALYAAAGGDLGDDKDAGRTPRLYGAVIDIGAHEFFNCPGVSTLYVDAQAAAGGDGSSWGNALQTLSQALQMTAYCTEVDSVLVAKGTYYPAGAQNDTNRDSSFNIIRGGLKLLGGYDAASGQRDIKGNKTILSGDIGTPGDSLDNSYHVMVLAGIPAGEGDIRVDGFTFRNGYADPNEAGAKQFNGLDIYRNNGAGIYATQVLNNTLITNSTIENNTAYFGGGMFNSDNSILQISHSSFSGNSACFGAGMVNGNHSAPQVINCIFTGNIARFDGGAMGNTLNSSPVIINCTLSANSADGKGGGIYNGKSSPALINQSLNNNTCSGMDMEIFNDDNSSPKIYNTIIWGNHNKEGGMDNIYNNNKGNPVFKNTYLQGDPVLWDWNAVSGGIDSSGNIISLDTPFVNTENDFHLDTGSLAINAGSNALAPVGISTDLEGNPRVVNDTIDMGAYEFNNIQDKMIARQPEDTTVCSGQDASFEISASGKNLHYQWQSSDNRGITWKNETGGTTARLKLKKAVISQSGKQYRVVVMTPGKRDTSKVVILTVNPVPGVTITPDKENPVSPNRFVRLAATGGRHYQWKTAPDIQYGLNDDQVTILPRKDAEYLVSVTDSNGCTALQRYSLQIAAAEEPQFSNIITPNGDGINDKWIIQSIGRYRNNELRIFDRSGRMVYQKKNYDNQWDGMAKGKPLHTGPYYYIFIVNGHEKIYKGYIELIRGKRGGGK